MVKEKWTDGKIVDVTHWTESLFSLKITATIDPFKAGQFTKLALHNGEQLIQRAYSFVNAPNDPHFEFLIVKVENGLLSHKLQLLQKNDTVMITTEASGFLTLDEVPDAKILWLLATGTAIGPFLSILQYGKGLERFHKIVLVHSVRYKKDICYQPLIEKLQKKHPEKLIIRTCLSREQSLGTLQGRIPLLVESRKLEESVGLKLDPISSHVMLCGNPGMISDTQALLKEQKNMLKHLRKAPGSVTTERYW